MMRICMVVHQYYHRDPRVKRYAEALSQKGVAVDIICPGEKKKTSSGHHQNIRVFTIPLKRNYKGKENYLYEYALGFFLYFFKLSFLFLKKRYKVIHIHNMPDFLVFAAILPRIFGAKIILDIHDLMPELIKSKFNSGEESLLLKLIKAQEKYSVRFSDAVITANSNFKNKLLERRVTKKKITVINNIADLNIFNREKYKYLKCKNNQCFTLIYPGTIAPRYGLNVAIEALPSLAEIIPGIKLKIIGTQVEYVKNLKELSEKLNVTRYIEFIPAIPIEEIPAQIITADIGIYTAIADSHMEIATPTKVIEYAVMGIPVIASRLQVLCQLFDESSIMFFEPGNIEQFTKCVFELYSQPDRRIQLVENADKIFIKEYSWEAEKIKYFSLLEKLM